MKSNYKLNAESSTIANIISSKELSIEAIVNLIVAEHEGILRPRINSKLFSGFIDADNL